MLVAQLDGYSLPAPRAKFSSEEVIKIEIKANDEIFINGSLSSTKKLMQILNKKSESDKEKITISFKAENDVIMNRLEKVHQILMEMSVFKIGYIKSTGEQLNLILPPPENELRLKQISKNDQLTLLVTAGGKVLVNNIEFNSEKIRAIVNKHLSENQYKIFIVQWESEAKFKDFLLVLEQVKQAGARRIIIGKGKPDDSNRKI